MCTSKTSERVVWTFPHEDTEVLTDGGIRGLSLCTGAPVQTK